jgi:Rad3-related DNA helicase
MFREGYIAYAESSPNDVRFRIFCMDPGEILIEIFKRARSAVIFSATLTPMKYYMDVLGGEEGDYRMVLKSPFPKENLQVFLDRRIDTRFSARENSFEGIADNIQAMAMMKKGNYMAFFPSYKYMNNVYEVFSGEVRHNN